VTGIGGGGSSKQLLDSLKETRGYGKLQEEALDRTLRRTGFGRGYGHEMQNTKCMNRQWAY
jgi:hypothetical protein